jgi:hypothetical protein
VAERGNLEALFNALPHQSELNGRSFARPGRLRKCTWLFGF